MGKNNLKELLNFSIINLDKPSGPTSFNVSQFVKEKLRLNKTSHLGTLDPGVSGVLPIALGRACKLNEYLMHKNKTYVGIMRLHLDVSDDELNGMVQDFLGVIKQLPPLKSSVKRAVREREILSFKILERQKKDVLFECEVQAGTYIRKLIHDIGEKIGGAHMLELRRIGAGIFEEPSVKLYEFEKAVEEYNKGDDKNLREMLIPAIDVIKKVLPVVQVDSKLVRNLLTGKPIHNGELKVKDERFAAFCKDKFIGIYRKVDEGEIISRPEFVFN